MTMEVKLFSSTSKENFIQYFIAPHKHMVLSEAWQAELSLYFAFVVSQVIFIVNQ